MGCDVGNGGKKCLFSRKSNLHRAERNITPDAADPHVQLIYIYVYIYIKKSTDVN